MLLLAEAVFDDLLRLEDLHADVAEDAARELDVDVGELLALDAHVDRV